MMKDSICVPQQNPGCVVGPVIVSCSRLPTTVSFCLSFFGNIYTRVFVIHVVTAK